MTIRIVTTGMSVVDFTAIYGKRFISRPRAAMWWVGGRYRSLPFSWPLGTIREMSCNIVSTTKKAAGAAPSRVCGEKARFDSGAYDQRVTERFHKSTEGGT